MTEREKFVQTVEEAWQEYFVMFSLRGFYEAIRIVNEKYDVDIVNSMRESHCVYNSIASGTTNDAERKFYENSQF